jgi:hypothetical protein
VELVFARPADQEVAATAAEDRIGSRRATQVVVPASPADAVVPVVAFEQVVLGAADQEVVA